MGGDTAEEFDRGSPTLMPGLTVPDVRRAIDWYVDVLGARRRGEDYEMPDGRIGHAELTLGGSVLALADEYPELDLRSPRFRGGPSQCLHLQVADCDAAVARALDAGADLVTPATDQPYGRNASVTDPFGHRWILSQPFAHD